jgi:20S proteasome alpha/beta subunit
VTFSISSICLTAWCACPCLLFDVGKYSYPHSTEEFTYDDGNKLGPTEIYEYLSRVMYSRRSKMNPLWNSLVVGGLKADGERSVTYSTELVGVLDSNDVTAVS